MQAICGRATLWGLCVVLGVVGCTTLDVSSDDPEGTTPDTRLVDGSGDGASPGDIGDEPKDPGAVSGDGF